jgi:hypothetical protein
MANYIYVYKNQRLEESAGRWYLDVFVPAFKKRFGYEPVIREGLRPTGDPSDIAGRDGIVYTGRNKGISTQWGFYNRYQKRLPGWTVAAYPGKSSHQSGTAIDFAGNLANRNTAEHKWAREFASQISWKQGEASREDWHFTLHVGAYSTPSAPSSGTQRQAASNGVKRRSEPNTKSQEGEMLAAGVIGNFVGFIRGENVNGNDVWFKGTSGAFFWSGGFTDSGTHDLPDLSPQQLSGTQRKVAGGDVKRRSLPSTSAPESGDFLPAGTVGNFVGFIRGENVNGNDVWFKGTSGAFFWSAGFTDSGTHDLPDLTPAAQPPVSLPSAVSGAQRVAGPGGVKRRVEPNATSPEAGFVLPEGTVGEFIGWIHGQSVSGNDVWFKGVSGNWFWSGGFTDLGTHDLPDLNTVTPQPEKPPVIVAPIPVTNPKPVEEVDSPQIIDVVASDFPAWVQYDEVIDSYTPDRNELAYEYYKAKYNQDQKYEPIESHTHWWDDPSKGATHGGVVNHLKNTKDLDVNFVTSAGHITKMIPLDICAYTTGARNMYAWKTENDPLLTEEGYKTLGLLHYIVEKKNPHLNGEAIRLHKEFMTTSCADLDVAKVRDYANRFKSGDLVFETGLPKDTQSPSEPVTEPIPAISGCLPPAVFKAYIEREAKWHEESATWLRDLIKNVR